jgi:hypothetical protein
MSDEQLGVEVEKTQTKIDDAKVTMKELTNVQEARADDKA